MTPSRANTAFRGYFRAFTLAGIPFYVHYGLPAFILMLLVVSQRDDAAGAAAFVAGFLLVLLAHEGAHAAAARYFGKKVYAIRLGAGGGSCRFEVPREVGKLAVIYAAGMVAQAVLLLGALLWLAVFGMPPGGHGHGLMFALVFYNAVALVLSLFPRRPEQGLPNDGYRLRELYRHVYRGQPHPFPPPNLVPAEESPVFPPETSLLAVEDLVPPGFAIGIEILNDRSTPMEFVVSTLVRHVAQDEAEAFHMMTKIHNQGGMLVPLPDMALARRAAAAITAHAQEQGHSFICRAVALSNGVRVA